MMQEFVEQINRTARAAVENMHTALPGVILEYDPETGMAAVQPKAKFRKPDGKTIDFPKVSGAPVVFPQSSAAAIAWAIKPGDGCLIVFAESALDYWMYGKETPTSLRFDLSNAIVIPGLLAEGSPAMRSACEIGGVVVSAGTTVLSVTPDGVNIKGNLTVDGTIQSSG